MKMGAEGNGYLCGYWPNMESVSRVAIGITNPDLHFSLANPVEGGNLPSKLTYEENVFITLYINEDSINVKNNIPYASDWVTNAYTPEPSNSESGNIRIHSCTTNPTVFDAFCNHILPIPILTCLKKRGKYKVGYGHSIVLQTSYRQISKAGSKGGCEKRCSFDGF